MGQGWNLVLAGCSYIIPIVLGIVAMIATYSIHRGWWYLILPLILVGFGITVQQQIRIEEKENETRVATESLSKKANELLLAQKELTSNQKQINYLLEKQVNEKPILTGEITSAILFPWVLLDASWSRTSDSTNTGILVYVRIENSGLPTTITDWHLTVLLHDKRMLKPEIMSIGKEPLRLACSRQPYKVENSEDLSQRAKQNPIQKTGEINGVLWWFARDVPLSIINDTGTILTLSYKDRTGEKHTLKNLKFATNYRDPCQGVIDFGFPG